MYRMKGIIPAVVTPFKKDGSINKDMINELTDFYVEHQIDCLLVCGSTGEYTLMDKDERQQVIDLYLKAARGRIPIMAGTGYHSTKETIAMTKYAEAKGVDAALVITPHYLKPTEAALIEHYQKIAAATSLPIIIYNWPGGTGINVSMNLIKELAEIDNIVGIKNTAPQEDTNTFISLTQHKDFDVVTGWETLLLPTLACGGAGGIGVSFNVVPALSKAIYDSFVVEKDLAKAQKLHNQLVPLFNAIFSEPSPGPIKAALELIGFPVGLPRAPINDISLELKQYLKELLKEYKVI